MCRSHIRSLVVCRRQYRHGHKRDITRRSYVPSFLLILQQKQQRIDDANYRTHKDSVHFVDTLISATPEFFEGKQQMQRIYSRETAETMGKGV